MQITPGSRLGPYEISSRVGAGGMGEVWAARDKRLDRDVAVKVLPEAVARDADRLRRFEVEARAAGALSHPNLVTIFDIGTHDGIAYVVMELLQGETLREKIGDGNYAEQGSRIPLRKAVDYASQIANGLSAAHEKGIIHRDLKPENIFITADGRLKILDFGLAKVSAADSPDASIDKTQERGTSPGTVLGTAGYMSPEQVRGLAADHRTDIFSLGAVLYEMLAGRRAFNHGSAIETMNAILKEDPPEMQDARTPVAPGFERIVRRCLEKTPAERFQSAHDITFALDAVTSTSSQRALVEIPSARRRALTIAAACAVLILACTVTGIVAWRAGRHTTAATKAPVTAARSFSQLTFGSTEELPSLSPDGKTFAFASDAAGRPDVYVQRVDGRNAINLTKDAPAESSQPAFSADGSQIAFYSARDGGGIFVMGATGESVRRLSDFGFNPAWSADSKEIVVGTDPIVHTPVSRPAKSELWILNALTGAKRRLLASDGVQPAWSPHGNRIAYWALVGNGGQRDLYTIDPHATDPAKSAVRLTDDAALDWSPAWSPDGKWLYFSSDRDGTFNLWRLPMDEASGKATGAMEPVTLPTARAGQFSIARNGDLAFATLDKTETDWLIPFDPVGARLAGEPRKIRGGGLLSFAAAEPSPDGEWWVFSSVTPQQDLYIMKRDGSGLRQLTNDPEKDRGPSFTEDGKLIYFYSQRGKRYEIYSIRPDGSGLQQVSTTTGRSLWFPRPFPGGNALLTYNENGAFILPFNQDGTITKVEPLPLPGPDARLIEPRISSDGSMIVGRVSGLSSMGGAWTYSVASKTYARLPGSGPSSHSWPKWLGRSNRLVVTASDHGLTVTDVITRATREVRLPMRVANFNFTPDGTSLLVHETSEESGIWLMKGGTQ